MFDKKTIAMIDLYVEYISCDHHKDRDCVFKIVYAYTSYKSHTNLYIEHEGYISDWYVEVKDLNEANVAFQKKDYFVF